MGYGLRQRLLAQVQRHASLAVLFRAATRPGRWTPPPPPQSLPRNPGQWLVRATIVPQDFAAPVQPAVTPPPAGAEPLPIYQPPAIQQTTAPAPAQPAVTPSPAPPPSAAPDLREIMRRHEEKRARAMQGSPATPTAGTPALGGQPLPPVQPEQPDLAEPEDADTSWRRLQAIMRKHQEKQSSGQQTETVPRADAPWLQQAIQQAEAEEQRPKARLSRKPKKAEPPRPISPDQRRRASVVYLSDKEAKTGMVAPDKTPSALAQRLAAQQTTPAGTTLPTTAEESASPPAMTSEPETEATERAAGAPPAAMAAATVSAVPGLVQPLQEPLTETAAPPPVVSPPDKPQTTPTPEPPTIQRAEQPAVPPPTAIAQPPAPPTLTPSPVHPLTPASPPAGPPTIDETPSSPLQPLPLEAVLPVQRQETEPPALPPSQEVQLPNGLVLTELSRTTTPPPGEPLLQRALEEEQPLRQILQDVATDQQSSAAVEFVLPRRPRPVPTPAPRPPQVQTKPAEAASGSDMAAPPVHGSTSAEPEEAEPQMIQTEIGALPSDLWTLIGQQPPSPPLPPAGTTTSDAAPLVQRAIAAAEEPPAVPAPAGTPATPQPPTTQRAIATAEAPATTMDVRAPSATQPIIDILPPLAVQRSPINGTSSTAAPQSASEDTPAAPPVDISELSRQVYAEIKRRIAIEWERDRRF